MSVLKGQTFWRRLKEPMSVNLWVLGPYMFFGLPLVHDRINLHLVTFAIKSVSKSLTIVVLWERSLYQKVFFVLDQLYLLHWSAAFWFIFLKNCVSVSTEKQISTLLEKENEVTVKPMLYKEPGDGGYLWFLECQYFLSLSVVF